MNIAVKIGSLTMANPVTVASGTFGYGVEYARLLDLNQLGAVVVKGIRLGPVKGNPTPRTAEVASGIERFDPDAAWRQVEAHGSDAQPSP